jgi:hypothetical protein
MTARSGRRTPTPSQLAPSGPYAVLNDRPAERALRIATAIYYISSTRSRAKKHPPRFARTRFSNGCSTCHARIRLPACSLPPRSSWGSRSAGRCPRSRSQLRPSCRRSSPSRRHPPPHLRLPPRLHPSPRPSPFNLLRPNPPPRPSPVGSNPARRSRSRARNPAGVSRNHLRPATSRCRSPSRRAPPTRTRGSA